jgi:hypothetical protein
LPIGWCAWRASTKHPWQRKKMNWPYNNAVSQGTARASRPVNRAVRGDHFLSNEKHYNNWYSKHLKRQYLENWEDLLFNLWYMWRSVVAAAEHSLLTDSDNAPSQLMLQSNIFSLFQSNRFEEEHSGCFVWFYLKNGTLTGRYTCPVGFITVRARACNSAVHSAPACELSCCASKSHIYKAKRSHGKTKER